MRRRNLIAAVGGVAAARASAGLAQTAGRPVEFQVVVHDPADIGLSAVGINNAVVQMQNTRFRGGLQAGGGASSGGASGGAGAAAGGGGNR